MIDINTTGLTLSDVILMSVMLTGAVLVIAWLCAGKYVSRQRQLEQACVVVLSDEVSELKRELEWYRTLHAVQPAEPTTSQIVDW